MNWHLIINVMSGLVDKGTNRIICLFNTSCHLTVILLYAEAEWRKVCLTGMHKALRKVDESPTSLRKYRGIFKIV